MQSEQKVWVAPAREGCVPSRVEGGSAGEKCGLPDSSAVVVIKGVNGHGRIFRPSDWCWRLAAAATYNCSYCTETRGRVVNPHVKVVIEDGVYSLRVSGALAEIDPPLYDFIIMFGRDNDLQMYTV